MYIHASAEVLRTLQWSQNHVQLQKEYATLGEICKIGFNVWLCYREKELLIEGEFWSNYLQYLKANLLIKS